MNDARTKYYVVNERIEADGNLICELLSPLHEIEKDARVAYEHALITHPDAKLIKSVDLRV